MPIDAATEESHQVLPAATPRAWLDGPLREFFSTFAAAEAAGARHRPLGVGDVLADDARVLRGLRDHLIDDGATARAAATYLAGWFGGLAATTIGYAYVAAGAGFVADCSSIRWQLHPDQWTDAVELGTTTALVARRHPWEGQPSVEVVADEAVLRARVVAALVDAVRPIVEACQGLARVGRVGLWNEVGDGFGSALALQTTVPVTEVGLERVRALVATPGVPWRARALLYPVETGLGTVCVMRKGGCCLAFTGSYEHDGEDQDQDQRDYREAFPDAADAPGYCDNCPRRDIADCEARQLWWRRREHVVEPPSTSR